MRRHLAQTLAVATDDCRHHLVLVNIDSARKGVFETILLNTTPFHLEVA